MDNLLLITLLLVFLTALIGAYVSRRSKERVLKDFDAYYVTVERSGGQPVWGRMRVYATGIELLFSSPYRTEVEGFPLEKSSFIFPQAHLSDVQSICRYHDELSPANQQRRRADIEKTYNPGFFRRMRRSIRNFLNTFRDAINESIGLLLLRMKTTSQSTVVQTQNQRIQRIGQEALGTVNDAYDPILENYIGRRVVVEWPDRDRTEVGGILKEYSPEWLLLLDCRTAREIELAFNALDRFRLQRTLDFTVALRGSAETAGGVEMYLQVKNFGEEPVWLDRLEGTAYSHSLDRRLRPGQTTDITVDDLPGGIVDELDRSMLPREWQLIAPERTTNGEISGSEVTDEGIPDLKLVINAVREVDLCLPRTRALVRHGGERVS